MVLSIAPEMIILLSCEKATDNTSLVCPVKSCLVVMVLKSHNLNVLSIRSVNTNNLTPTARNNVFAVFGDSNRRNEVTVTFQGSVRLADFIVFFSVILVAFGDFFGVF